MKLNERINFHLLSIVDGSNIGSRLEGKTFFANEKFR